MTTDNAKQEQGTMSDERKALIEALLLEWQAATVAYHRHTVLDGLRIPVNAELRKSDREEMNAAWIKLNEALSAQPSPDAANDYRKARAEAEQLATALWKKHYKDDAPNWGLCDSLAGVMTQIDNMTCQLIRPSPDAAQGGEQGEVAQAQKPCGGRTYCGRFPFCGCGEPNPLPERQPNVPAENQGLFRKFDVRRTDGSDKPGGKHEGCEYFVLDVKYDPHAKAALAAYADACEFTHTALACDMRERYELARAPHPSQAGAEAVDEGMVSVSKDALRRIVDAYFEDDWHGMAVRSDMDKMLFALSRTQA